MSTVEASTVEAESAGAVRRHHWKSLQQAGLLVGIASRVDDI